MPDPRILYSPSYTDLPGFQRRLYIRYDEHGQPVLEMRPLDDPVAALTQHYQRQAGTPAAVPAMPGRMPMDITPELGPPSVPGATPVADPVQAAVSSPAGAAEDPSQWRAPQGDFRAYLLWLLARASGNPESARMIQGASRTSPSSPWTQVSDFPPGIGARIPQAPPLGGQGGVWNAPPPSGAMPSSMRPPTAMLSSSPQLAALIQQVLSGQVSRVQALSVLMDMIKSGQIHPAEAQEAMEALGMQTGLPHPAGSKFPYDMRPTSFPAGYHLPER